MREILFRGKTKKDNQWVYGSYIAHEISIEWAVSEDGVTLFGEGAEVKEDTVSEFTGLYDRNGKRIFEGDIVKANVGEREYEDEYLSNTNILVSFENGYFYPFAISCGWRSWVSDIEVIGNKWDNPELLEDKE